MRTQRKQIRIIAAVSAVLGLALAGASSGEAKSRVPAPEAAGVGPARAGQLGLGAGVRRSP